jgi:hypothetical protein
VVGSGLTADKNIMGWEDVLGLLVSFGLLYYLLRAMLKAEEL